MACADCVSGHAHDGEPKGKVIKLHGLDTYLAEPDEGSAVKGIIVIIPDGFGWSFVNNRLLADHYAHKGSYRVYLPEFMRGHPCPIWMMDTMAGLMGKGNYLWKPYHFFWALYGFVPFLWYNTMGASGPIVQTFFEKLRATEAASLPLGAAGFCWGGKHVVRLAAEGLDLYDAGFTGHPSAVEVPAEIERIAKPVSFALGDQDSWTPVVIAERIRALVEAKPAGQKGEVRIYEKCGHGFCVRADPTNDDVTRQAEEAEDQCMAWFNDKLKVAS